MNIQTLEVPVLLFKSTAGRIFGHTNSTDIIDNVMTRYADYLYLIQDIQAAKSLEDLESLKETYKEPDLYSPAQDMRDLYNAVMLIVATATLYDAIATEANTNNCEQSQVSKLAYDALKKDYDNLQRMFEIEKQATEAILRGVNIPGRANE